VSHFFVEDPSAPVGFAAASLGLLDEGGFKGWEGIKASLTEFAQLPHAYQLLDSIFDIKDRQAAHTTLNAWREGVFDQLPRVSVLTDAEMQGALGGYSSEYRRVFLAESIAGIDSITGKVLAEELGHHLDLHFNGISDTNGDEGDLFSRILFGFEICKTDLSNMMSEDDSGLILFGHNPISVEKSQVAIESMGGLLYQTQRGTDSKIYTRVSVDGKAWSPWNEAGGVTNSAPSLAALNGTLYQVHRGVDSKIYTRSSGNGSNWTNWHEAGGVTESAPAVAALNDRIYQSHRGLDNKIYTRSSVNGTIWTNWHEAGGETNHAPALATLNGRLYQSIKGINNKIYTRSSTNGTSWTTWHEAGGVTYSHPALEAANGRLYQSHRGTDNQIYTRSSTDGTNWTNWHQAGGVTDFAPSIASHNGRLYQTHRGLDNLIYTRSSTDGVNWDRWDAGATTSASSYRVDRLNSDGTEGSKHTFKIFRSGNTAVAGQVRFSTSPDSATSDVDFSSYTAVRNFAPGQTEDIVYVDSRTDNLNEGTERFNVSISKVNNADTITTASTFGQIFNLTSTPSPSFRYPVISNSYSFSSFQDYGPRAIPADPFHHGIDFGRSSGVAVGTAVYATASGIASVRTQHSTNTWNDGRGPVSYGKYIQIDHANGYTSFYAHLDSFAIINGQHVEAGQLIGRAGNTGFSQSAHLHFEIRLNGKSVDPLGLLRK